MSAATENKISCFPVSRSIQYNFQLPLRYNIEDDGQIAMKPYKSTILAKYIAAYLNTKRVDMNITKIQKLAYIMYGTYLAATGERLIDEHPQAWPYGPVFPHTRENLLKCSLYEISMSDEDLKEISNDKAVSLLMDKVFTAFGSWSASQLSGWSHKEGSPWEAIVSTPGFKWSDRIDDDSIKAYFKRLVRRQTK